MPALLSRIVERIRREGPIPFAVYMALALYDPRAGYYSAGAARTGRGGHFITSPELDTSFGCLWARAFERIWRECGEPPQFSLIEIGGGEGGFARAVLAALSPEALAATRLTLVERVTEVEARQRQLLAPFGEKVAWAGSLAEVERAEAGCVFANEVLDNVPVHLVERREGGLVEIYVDVDGDRLVERAGPPSTDALVRAVERLDPFLPEGVRAEVAPAVDRLIATAAGCFTRGAVVFVDYGMPWLDLLQRPAGTLACYSGAGVDDQPLQRPGEKDITAHVNWTAAVDALREVGLVVGGPLAQRRVLANLGLGDLDHDLRAEHAEALARGDGAAAVRALSRRHALRALADADGLGGFDVLVGSKQIPVAFMTG